jgi:hypothetical protein
MATTDESEHDSAIDALLERGERERCIELSELAQLAGELDRLARMREVEGLREAA